MTRSLAVAVGALLAFAPTADANTFSQLAGAAGCLMQIDHDVEHGCGRVGGLDDAQSVALSPDDRFVYVASGGTLFGGSNGVVVFRRDVRTGALTKTGCVTATGGDGRLGSEQACALGDALVGASDVAIAPDGAAAIVASTGSGGLAWFARDAATGALTPAGCVKDFPRADRCAPVPGLRGVVSVAFSPDGLDVYAVSPITATIQRLRRSGSTLMSAGCVSHTGSDGRCQAAPGLRAVWDVAVAPDGRMVYAAGFSGAVTAFARNPETGELTQTACLLDRAPTPGPCRDAGGIAGATDVTVSPDSRDIYVVSSLSDAVTGFRVQPDGTLRQTVCLERVPEDRTDGFTPDKRCRAGTAIWDPEVVTISGDGRTVFAGGADTITAFRRDAATGTLTQTGCAEERQSSKDCFVTRATFGVNALAATADGRNVYVTATAENAVTVLGAAVAVTPAAARADRRGRVRVRLACPRVRVTACAGRLRVGGGAAQRYRLRPGQALRTWVRPGRALRRRGVTRLEAVASDRALHSTRTTIRVRGRG